MTRCGVLVHGYNLDKENWEHVVWGKPPDQLGRLPRAAEVIWKEDAVVAAFGTGASEKDGKKEAEYIIDFLLSKWSELHEFAPFQHLKRKKLKKFRSLVERIAIAETKSQRTSEEVLECGRIFRDYEVNKVILVSSADHISRCLRDAQIAFQAKEFSKALFRRNVYATAAATCYTAKGLQGVVIEESSHHRG